jgi:hypothetical protein
MKTTFFYSVFNNGKGYSDVALHATFQDAEQTIVGILERPENMNQIPEHLRRSVQTWEDIHDMLIKSEYLNNWIIEIGSVTLPIESIFGKGFDGSLDTAKSAMLLAGSGCFKLNSDDEFERAKIHVDALTAAFCSLIHHFNENKDQYYGHKMMDKLIEAEKITK